VAYLQNGLQLNPDKSEALIVGTTNQLLTSDDIIRVICVHGRSRPAGICDELKVLGLVLNRRLTFHKHVSAVARVPCTGHPTHSTTYTELAQTHGM